MTITFAMETQVDPHMQPLQVGSGGKVLQIALQTLMSPLVFQDRSYDKKKAAFNEELGSRLDALDWGEGICQKECLACVEDKTATLRELSQLP